MSQAPLVREHSDSAVVIAGGTSGVGLASAVAFAAAGVPRIALLGRDAERGRLACERVLAEFPDTEVRFRATDAAQPDQVADALGEIHRAFGAIDVLVSSVIGTYRPELLHRIDPADMSPILLSTVLPPMLLTQAVLPYMTQQGGGSIVTLASDAAKVATPGESVLGGAMAAIVMFSKVAAIEAKRHGIRVNAVTPSLIAGTPTAENVLRDGFSKGLFEKAVQLAHLGVAEPADLAALIVFLGGPGAARLTGQVISVNGGISAA